MTPTDDLCARLDELGIKHTTDDSNDYEIIEWQGPYNLWWQFVYDPYEEEPYGELRLVETGGATHLTPEQAIAATVGVAEDETDARALIEAIRDDDGVRYSMDEVLDIMRKDVAATVNNAGYGIQFADWCEFPPETMVGETVFDGEGNAIGWIVNATVGAGTCKRVYHPNRLARNCTCSNCGYGASDERWAYCPKCGHKYVHGEVEERWKKAGRKVAE